MKINILPACRGVCAGFLFLLLLGGVAPAQVAAPVLAATTISKVPFTITKTGLYLMKKDLIFNQTTGTAITVTAPNVVIDLGGHELSCSFIVADTNLSIGIQSGAGSGDLTVRHGTLSRFLKGGLLGTSASSGVVIVEDLTVKGCGQTGLSVSGRFAEVHGCRILNTGGVSVSISSAIRGLEVYAPMFRIVENSVSEMKVTGQEAIGIYTMDETKGGLCMHNAVSQTQKDGHVGYLISGFAIVNDNSVFNCTTGFYFGVTSIKYRDNSTLGCVDAFVGGSPVGSNNN